MTGKNESEALPPDHLIHSLWSYEKHGIHPDFVYGHNCLVIEHEHTVDTLEKVRAHAALQRRLSNISFWMVFTAWVLALAWVGRTYYATKLIDPTEEKTR